MHARAAALVSVFGLQLVVSGCGGGGNQKRQGPPPVAVDVSTAKRHDIATFVSLDGQIAPLQESTLSLPQSGMLQSIAVREGERVSAGEVLAKIDDSTFRAQLAQAQAQVAQARANLESSTLTSPITRTQVSSSMIQSQQQVLQAKNSLASARSAYETAKTQYESNKQLAQQGYLAQTALDQSRSQAVAAEEQFRSAQASVALAQAASRAAQQNMGQTGVQVQDVAAKRGSLEAAQAQVRLLEAQIAQTTLSAPYEGVVTQRFLDPGALASPNQPILRLSQISSVYVNANVPDEDLSYVRHGTPAAFTSASLPGRTFHGLIDSVNATPTQGTLSYRARIRQPNADGQLRGGMLVTLRVRKEQHRGAVVVPRTAIFQTDQGTNVYTVSDGKAKAITVEVGLQTDTESEVRGNRIAPGTVVITTRPDALQDGSVVAVGGQPPGPAPKK